MKETKERIMDAAMQLLIEKGYGDTTTLDIAQRAGVNEATLFRRFGTKKEIIQSALETGRWTPHLDTSFFSNATWDLKADLAHFMQEYFLRVPANTVKLSIGLRSPQIYEETAPHIMQVPTSFINALEAYFKTMQKKGKCRGNNPHALALTLFTSTLGFTFLQASFGNNLSPLTQQEFVQSTLQAFVDGIKI